MADSAPSSPDRLTNLPNHILLHILSFLPTKMVLASSVLSKPWQHLWALVPTIDLHVDEDHLYVNDDLYVQGFYRSRTFEHSFISKVLDRNKSPIIRRFRLVGHHCETSDLDKWVSSAAQRKVEELDLAFDSVSNDHEELAFDSMFNDVIPSNHNTFAFSCAYKTLVVMKVMIYGHDDSQFFVGGHLDDDLYFPTLRILHFKRVLFETLDPFCSSRFPSLEELLVHRVRFRHDINISLPMLRRLGIVWDWSYSEESILDYSFNVEAPRLQCLVLTCFGSGVFRVENVPDLVEANLDVFYPVRGNKHEEYGESLISFMNALSNVRTLNLANYTVNELCYVSSCSFFHVDRIQPFRNLVKVDLILCGSTLGIMMIMLSKFENLQHLKVTENSVSKRYDKTEYCFTPPTHVANCLTYSLKTFCFQYFKCSKYEVEFAVYILKNSLVLENLKILFRPGLVWKKGYDAQTTLSTISKGSSECQLEFNQEVRECEYDNDSPSAYSE